MLLPSLLSHVLAASHDMAEGVSMAGACSCCMLYVNKASHIGLAGTVGCLAASVSAVILHNAVHVVGGFCVVRIVCIFGMKATSTVHLLVCVQH
jgi:hypothetical protein